MDDLRRLVCPPRVSAILRFQGILQINPAVFATSASYAINNPYDPYIPTGGGSCTGYSQWMGLYDYCFVTSVDIRMTYHNTSTTAPGIQFVLPYPSSQTPGVVTRDVIMESVNGVYFENFCGQSSYNPHTLRVSYDLKRIEGSLSPMRDYSSTADADPVHEIAATIGVMNEDGSATGASGTLSFQISYHCTFWQRKMFGVA